ncbi:MAG: phosphoribosylformylglycinamidine synthase subunit PurQ [Defluviicoccus sp.]|nr:phosphoribosylformylglycinamidine synthase subunit PurQ [Defluviicoccus sp.]MDE0386154.1 phosphoribosylformylglycinamidine synthase subunit PurQ [Defluviicoccus sp.]
MKAAVIVFPGSNCDRDTAVAIEAVAGRAPAMVWHAETELPAVDLIAIPGGFAYGDYLRSGAMAAHSPVMRAVAARARAGTPVLGICNGFQVLTEAGLLPGALMRNAGLRFICRDVALRVERSDTVFTRRYAPGAALTMPVAHNDGNYVADSATIDRLEGEGLVAFRYRDNPNGSAAAIAGIFDPARRILGMMPHPERAADAALGGIDGRALFESLADSLA